MKVNIVFEGGGVRGLAYIGVLKFLEERGICINQIGGTSVGAIIASLAAVGYSSSELLAIVEDFDFSILKHYEEGEKGLLNALRWTGIFSLANFEGYIHSLLERKHKTIFLDVKSGDKYLLKMVVAEWITKRKVVIPDELGGYGIDPDSFPIAKAAAMSSSIPLFYRHYRIKGYRFVDGGLVSNFPIDLFSESRYPTWGFCVTKNSLDKAKLMLAFRKKIFKMNNNFDMENYDRHHIINIDTFRIRAVDYQKGMKNKEKLIYSGYESTKNFFYNSITK